MCSDTTRRQKLASQTLVANLEKTVTIVAFGSLQCRAVKLLSMAIFVQQKFASSNIEKSVIQLIRDSPVMGRLIK